MEGTQVGGARQAEGARGGPGPTRADAKRLQKMERGEKNSGEEGAEGEGREERRAGGGSWTQNTMSLLGSRYSLSLWTWALPTSPHDTPQPPRP